MESVWAGVSAVCAIIALLVVVAGTVYARRQLEEARTARQVNLLLTFQATYHSVEMRHFRDRLLTGALDPPEELEPLELSREDRVQFWRLHDQLEFLGLLVHRQLLDFELVASSFGLTPPRVWSKMHYVIERRRRDYSDYSLHFEKLINRYPPLAVAPVEGTGAAS